MASPVATLGGFPILGSSTVSWTLREGVAPVEATFDFRAKDAENLFGSSQGGQVLDLVLISNGTQVIINRLQVIQAASSDVPSIMRVRVADRRWRWPYVRVLKRYNVRRHIGVKSVSDVGVVDLAGALRQLDPKIWYAEYSLKTPPEGKWTAEETLKDVISEVLRNDGLGEPGDFYQRGKFDGIPVEDLEIDESGESAIGRVLGYMPEAGIYVNAEGNVVVFNRTDGREVVEANRLSPPIVGQGIARFVQNSITRPRKVRVYFTREVEVRFDYSEFETGLTNPGAGKAERFLDNVLPVPDHNIELATGEVEAQGTWITFNQVFISKTWTSPPPPGLGGPFLNHSFLRRAFIPFLDLFTALRLTGLTQPDIDWAARVSALEQNWRTTFRINRRWMDQTLMLRASRIGIVNRVTGTRAPAAVYSDFCIVGSQRSQLRSARGQEAVIPYAINVDGYPAGGVIDSTTKQVPAILTILDHDQGIVQVQYRVDPNKVYDVILPSKIEETGMPGANLKSGGRRPIGWNHITTKNGNLLQTQLEPNFKLAMILTLIPASPNSKAQLHAVEVEPKDVFLPGGAAIGTANGPVMEVRVDMSEVTALIPWNDNEKTTIEALFGMPGALDGKPTPLPSAEAVNKLVLNLQSGNNPNPDNTASLNAYARAVAARVYARFVDRVEGTQATHLSPKSDLQGWMSELTHEVTTDGTGLTRGVFPDAIPALSLRNFMDAGMRAVVDKIPPNSKG